MVDVVTRGLLAFRLLRGPAPLKPDLFGRPLDREPSYNLTTRTRLSTGALGTRAAGPMAQLTEAQQRNQARADELGREFVTTIDGRVSIILRPRSSDEATSEALARVARALEAAGIA